MVKGSLGIKLSTFDYTESCRQVLNHSHRCWKVEVFYSTDGGHEGVWVGIARNVVIFHGIVALRFEKLAPKNEVVRTIGCRRRSQNWHHVVARERF